MFEPVKEAFSRFMVEFRQGVVPTTPELRNFLDRKTYETMVWAPTRMIDKAEEMLKKFQRVDMNRPTDPHDLPVIIIAMARDYSPTGRDYTRQVADPVFVTLPDDPKERMFKLRTVSGDIRVQIAIFTRHEPSAKSLAAQFLLFLDETARRRFWATYRFAGFETKWPVQIEAPDSPAMNIESGSENLNILAIDLTLKVTTPIYYAPGVGEPNDGKGTPGSEIDPAGYPFTREINFAGGTDTPNAGAETNFEKKVSESTSSGVQ